VKKFRLSFGRSCSVEGGVRKLGLGVAGTGGGISAGMGIGGTCGGISTGACGIL
jgi:hypothetical protein